MTKKRSQQTIAVEPPRVDDLRLIDGIGPAIERRLHHTGIYTFAQLAALSPADIAASIADIAGLTTERIVKQDWIGQARRLMAQMAQQDAEENSDRVIALTEDPELLDAGAVSEREPEPAGFAEPLAHRLSGMLRLGNLEFITNDAYAHRSVLPAQKRFALRVTLDFRRVAWEHKAPLAYSLALYGLPLGTSDRVTLGKAQGHLTPEEEAVLEVQGIATTPGIYRLLLSATLTREPASDRPAPDLLASIEGGPLQFF